MTTRAFTGLLGIAALALSVAVPPCAVAQTTAPAPAAHKAPMHPRALTLGTHRARPHHQGVGRLGNTRGRQLHTMPTHGTMGGPRI